MYYCDICKRECKKKIRYGGYTLCSKHMHQLQKYKKFLDSNPRTSKDLNEYKIDKKNKIAIFYLYDTRQNKKGEFIIDLDDLDKVKYRRWRDSYGYIKTGYGHRQLYLSHILLNIKETDYYHKIDHIDGNPYNNKKSNLRVCTQGDNLLNKHYMKLNTTGVIGVSVINRPERSSNYAVEIRYRGKRFRLGEYILLIDAAYARYVAQNLLFQEFSNNENFKDFDFKHMSKIRKKEIKKYVTHKIEKKLKKESLD